MANVGLFGFLKLDAEGIKKGVNDSKMLLAELEASYDALQKSAVDAVKKIEIDPKAARAGLRDLTDSIYDVSKSLDEAEKKLSKFYMKVGADPETMKKGFLETKDALHELAKDAENLIEVKIKVSHQEVKDVTDRIKEDLSGAQGLFDPILNDFRKMGKVKMVDPDIIKEQLSEVSSHISDVRENLNTIKDVTIEADASQVKKEFVETNDNLVRLKTSLAVLKKQLGDYGKFGIDTEPFTKQINVVEDWIGKLKTDMSSISKIDFAENMEGFKERLGGAAEKFAHMKEEALIAKKEITDLSKTPIDISPMEKSFSGIMEKIVDADVAMTKMGMRGQKEFTDVGDTLTKLTENVSDFRKEITKSGRLGLDAGPLKEQVKEASEAIRRLKAELKATSKIDFVKDTEKFYEKADLAAKTFSQIKGNVSSIKTEMAKFAGTSVDLSGIQKGFAGVTKEVTALGPLMEKVTSRGEKEFIQLSKSMGHKFSDVGNDIRNLLSDITHYKGLGVNTEQIEGKVKRLQELVTDLKMKFTEMSNMTVDTDTEALKKGMEEFNNSLDSVKEGLSKVEGRAEEVFKKEAWHKRMSATWRNLSDTLASVSAKFLLIQFALNRMSAMVVSAFRPAFTAIESFRESIVQMAATITSLQMPEGNEIAEAYIRAKSYAEGLLHALQKIDENSIATMNDLKVMTDQFVKHGVLLDYMSDSAVEAYKNIANAIAVIAQAYPARATQVAQEARALMQGSTDIRGALSSMLDKMMGGRLKENLELWRQQGTVIENIGKHLKGFAAASDDVSTLWSSISATMQNIRDRILRGGFTDSYNVMMKALMKINEFLKEHEKTLIGGIKTAWELTVMTAKGVWVFIEPLVPALKLAGEAALDIVKLFTVLALDIGPKFVAIVRTAFFPFRAVSKVIEGLYDDMTDLNFSFTETKNEVKEVVEETKSLGQEWKDAVNDTVSNNFIRSLELIGVRFEPLKEGIQGIVTEMDKFSQSLADVARQRWTLNLTNDANTFIKKTEEIKKKLEDIKTGKVTFGSKEEFKQAFDFIKIEYKELYREMESKPDVKLRLDLAELDEQFKTTFDNVETLFEMLDNDSTPKIPALSGDWEKTIDSFYSEAKVKSDKWFENEVRNLDRLKGEWMKLAEEKDPETGKPRLTKEEVYKEHWRRTMELNKEMVSSRQETVNKLKELDSEITEHSKTELDKQIFTNEMWGEKMKDTVWDLAQELEIPLEEVRDRLNIIDEAVLAKNKTATQDYKKDIIEAITEINLAIAEAKEKTGQLDFIQATDDSIASLERLKAHYEKLSLEINKATDEKKWLENQKAIEETKQKIAELKSEIVDFQAKAGIVEIEIRIKGIERREALFEISQKQAVQETIQEYEELLARQEKAQEQVAAAGNMEAWTLWNERIGETREKLLELETTAMQVSDNMTKGILDGLKRYYNDHQSMYEKASDAMHDSAEHAAETLSDVFSDFRHGELEEWHEYLGEFAEMVLQTLERLIAQMLIAKALGAALGFSFPGSGGGGSNDPFAKTDEALDFHTGGYIGRFHGGGAAGLKSDEVPAVLQSGEGVLSRKEMMKLGGETGFERLREMIKKDDVLTDPESSRTSYLDNGRYNNRIQNSNSETNISVPVNVEGGNRKLEVRLKDEIEKTVRRVIKEMI